jgi:catalase
VQVFDEDWAAKQPYDVLDATKLIPEEEVPVRIIGRMTLNRNPDNFFAETEQVAFAPPTSCPASTFRRSVAAGAPVLLSRHAEVAPWHRQFPPDPINAPKCPFHNFQRDGMMQTQVPKGRANYEPNSLNEAGEDGGPRECPATGFTSFAHNIEPNDGNERLRIRPELFADHYSQARLFYRSQTPVEQAHLASAIVFELSKVALDHVRARVLSRLRHVDEDLAGAWPMAWHGGA